MFYRGYLNYLDFMTSGCNIYLEIPGDCLVIAMYVIVFYIENSKYVEV